MRNRSIAVSLQQHSYRAAQAYLNSDTLDRYYTTAYNDNKLLYRMMRAVLPKGLSIRVMNRQLAGLNGNVKKYCEMRGLLFLGSGRIPFLQKNSLQIRASMNRSFGKHVAKDCAKRNTSLLLMYDTMAYDCFKWLKKQGTSTVKVLDMASTCVVTIRRIIDEEIAKGYSFTDSMREKALKYTDASVKQYVDEIQLADYYLSPSDFVTNSLIDIGIAPQQIKYLPHGVDVKQFTPTQKQIEADKPLKFLFVGRVEAAKGIYYLAEAFKDQRIRNANVELLVVGAMETNIENFKDYPENIKILGLKRRDEMPQIYDEADVFILSSLWEGSSLSMLEAMASGLPVIASKYSCAPEVVEEAENGFVVEPKDISQLVEKILWFDNNRDKIPDMSRSARKRIEDHYSWEHYYDKLNKVSEEILEKVAEK